MAAGSKPWWVVWDANANSGNGSITVVQAATKPPEPASGNVFGPFKTKAEADKAAQPNSSLFQQLGLGASVGAGIGASILPGGEAVPNVSNPLGFLGGLVEIGHWIGVFVSDITDPHMWISLGWLFLGLILLVIGIILWLKHEDLLPKVAPVPVPV